MDRAHKDLIFLPGSQKTLLKLPAEVRREIGHAIWLAQNGKKADSAKPLKGGQRNAENEYG